MVLEKVGFAEIEPGQVFLSKHGSMYRKKDQRSAILIRLSSGEEPTAETVDSFPNDEKVELVPTKADRDS